MISRIPVLVLIALGALGTGPAWAGPPPPPLRLSAGTPLISTIMIKDGSADGMWDVYWEPAEDTSAPPPVGTFDFVDASKGSSLASLARPGDRKSFPSVSMVSMRVSADMRDQARGAIRMTYCKKGHPVPAFADVEILPDRRIVISPVRVIPLHEMWAWSPESTIQTDAAIKDYKAGRAIGVKALDVQIVGGGSRRGKK